MSDTFQEREEAIRSVIARATVEAFEDDEVVTISVCMAPCISGGLECPLCERISVTPQGIVSREARRH